MYIVFRPRLPLPVIPGLTRDDRMGAGLLLIKRGFDILFQYTWMDFNNTLRFVLPL